MAKTERLASRISDKTRRQIADLMAQFGDSESGVVARAIDKLYTETFPVVAGWIVAYHDPTGANPDGYMDAADPELPFLDWVRFPFLTREEAQAAADHNHKLDGNEYTVLPFRLSQ